MTRPFKSQEKRIVSYEIAFCYWEVIDILEESKFYVGWFSAGRIFQGKEVSGEKLLKGNYTRGIIPEFLYKLFLFDLLSLWQFNFSCRDIRGKSPREIFKGVEIVWRIFLWGGGLHKGETFHQDSGRREFPVLHGGEISGMIWKAIIN